MNVRVYKGNTFAVRVYNDVFKPAAACPGCGMRVPSSFNEDQWMALALHFHPDGLSLDMFTVPILIVTYQNTKKKPFCFFTSCIMYQILKA